jgi:hypothetical protein
MVDLSRQTNLVAPIDWDCLVIGAGAIGSNAVATLVKMGVQSITLYDDDIVQDENLAPGLFDRRMIGKPKVLSVKSIVNLMTGFTGIIAKPIAYVGQQEDAEVVVLGVDSLEARIAIFESLDNISGMRYLIDGRIGGHNCSVYAVDVFDKRVRENYRETLNVEPAPLPCGSKATRYIVDWCTATIGNVIRCIANGQKPPYFQHWAAEEGQNIII